MTDPRTGAGAAGRPGEDTGDGTGGGPAHDTGEGRRPAPVHAQMVTGAHLDQGWHALSTMLSAMLVFGLPSWWLSEALDQVWIIPVGLVLGMATAIATIWVRYGVHGP